MIFIKKNFSSLRKILIMLTFGLPSAVRIPILRRLGFKIGRNVTICPFTIIIADSVEIGNDVFISPLVLIFNLKKIKLGNRVLISMGNLIHSHGLGSLELGDFSATGLFSFIDCTCDIVVGKYSCLGPRAMLSTHGNFLPKNLGFSNRYAPIKIGKYVWLMMDVKVTSGVCIGDYVIAHAGTVIMTDIPANSVYTHARHNFQLYPMSIIYRKTVTSEYIKNWKSSLFSKLPLFIKNYFNVTINCLKRDGIWEITTREETIKIWDGDAINDFSKVTFNKNDIVIFFQESSEKAKQALCSINWLDIEMNLYSKKRHFLIFDYIVFYFEMEYAVFFTLYKG